MSQLRWALLILGVVFIAALGWWEWRRPRQGRSGDAGLRPAGRAVPREAAVDTAAPPRPREPPLELPEIRARGSLATDDLPVLELARDEDGLPLPGAAESAPVAAADVPPEADLVPEADLAPEADVAPEADLAPEDELPVEPSGVGDPPVDIVSPLDANPPADTGSPSSEPAIGEVTAAEPEEMPEGAPQDLPGGELPTLDTWQIEAVPAQRVLPRESLPELPAAPAPLVNWPRDTERRVVALRLVAMQPARFAGRSVRQALAAEGFVLGKFAIFHKPDEEQRAVLSAASLTRPGTFDPQTMDSQHYGGLSLFAVVPGPRPLPETFEELVSTARSLNERLQGMLQDEAGSPLTPARIASLREHLGRETPA